MACFALVTSATEADVLRQAWIRKVQELKLGLPDNGGTVAFFRSLADRLLSIDKRCNFVIGFITFPTIKECLH